MSKLTDLLKQSDILIKNADTEIERQMLIFSRNLLLKTQGTLRNFATVSGTLDYNSTDLNLLNDLKKELLKHFANPSYKSAIEKYLSNFDQVELLSKETISIVNPQIAKSNLAKLGMTAERKMIADAVVNNLIKNTAIETTFIAPIQRLLYQAVSFGSSYTETEKALREYILGNPNQEGSGYILRYVKQITRDSLNQFQGEINAKVAKQYNLNAFSFVGSAMKTTRQNCLDMIDGLGALEKFHKGRGIYLISDLPEIIEILKKGKGWNPAATAETYIIYVNGFNCRHKAIPRIYREPNQTPIS